MHPDSISTNADDDDEVEQVVPSTSAGLGTGIMSLVPSQSTTNDGESNDQDGDRGGEDLEYGDHDNDDDANGEKEYKCNICTNVFFNTRDSMRRHIVNVHVDEYVELQLRKATEGPCKRNCKSQTQTLTPPTTPEVHLVFMLNNNDEIEIEVPVNTRVSNSTSSNAETEQPQPSTSAELGNQDQVPCTSVSSEVSPSSGETSSPTRQQPTTSSSSPRSRGELVMDMVPVSPPPPSNSSLLRKKRGKAIDKKPSTSAGVRASSKPESEVSKKKNNSNKSRRGGNQSSTIVQLSTRMIRATKRKHEEVPAPVAPPNCRKSKRLLDKKQCEDSSGGKKEATTPTKLESSPCREIKEAASTCSTSPSVDSSDPTLVLSKNKGPTLALVNH
ncbi:unnamed protein product [Orchesella dallaii]|uniref:C2H2-type domain-containing protein n=1 Tax=Orchesella dallaii TaxID=48710 RepID=A0ABP1PUX2_9HEXA